MLHEQFKTIRGYISNRQFAELERFSFSVPQTFNWVKEVFEDINCVEFPQREALIWTNGSEVKTYTYDKLRKRTNQLLNFLRKYHVEAGEVILSQMPQLPPIWFTILASIKGGYRLIPAATILSVNDIVYRFETLMPKVVIADLENAEKIDEAEKISGKQVSLKILVEGTKEGWISYSEIEQESDEASAAETRSNEALFLFFTSGTTGMPKVVTHTHVSYPLGHLTTASWIGLKPGDVHYNVSQPGWAKFAWSSVFAPWNMGATIFAFNQPGRFNAAQQLEHIEKFKITTFCAPPTVLRMLIQEDLKAYKLSLKECVAAGEPLNPEIIDVWQKGTGLLIRDGYGQTESTCIIGNLPGTKVKFGSMGKPTFLYDVVIANETGEILPVHEEGNITVRTDSDTLTGIFDEYLGDPEKKKAVFKHDLYYTGDKAYMDEDGYYWFVGRDDDVIKSSDYRVGPFEVESILLEHDAVIESAVVGSPHPVKGFEIKAFVILGPEYQSSQALADEIFLFSRGKLAPYKMPRIIEFVTELPKTISGKIRRVELRALEAEAKLKNRKNDFEFGYTK
ncbi:AMP-binding protein [Fluviicola sp.]|uniref:acyl-CoA synthetase n=1 Tax=Fluviicola sp. TaxID=1917219 RepID=UPI002627E775|nr:AMP-binding protein [Fluviicola sp.]